MVIKTNVFNTNYVTFLYRTIEDAYKNQLKAQIDHKVINLNISGYVTKEPVSYHDRQKGNYKSYKIGDAWGSLFACAWFHLTGKIDNFDQTTDYFLKLDVAGEACLFDDEGTPYKGFTNGSSTFDRSLGEPGKLYSRINDFIDKDGNVSLWIESGANDLFGNLSNEGRLQIAQVVKRDLKLQELYNDFESLYSLLQSLDQNHPRYQELLTGLLKASYPIIYQDQNAYEKSQNALSKLFKETKQKHLKVYAVGHAHMDLAWLWPIRETRRKMGRTIANVIKHLETHPNYVFGISQPQQFIWIKEDYPKLYEKLKTYVKQGRIELQGGMWVESDTNITGEESLARQMLYGVKFYEEEFDFKVKNLWLPDVFGYSGSLPQIIKQAGMDYFMTIKISWNMINTFPYHTFNWKGIDGTSILCHMPPEGTYNSPALPRSTYQAAQNYKEKEQAPLFLSVYGIGDGGGGPGDEHLSRIDRQVSLDPLSEVKYSRADEFFNDLSYYQDQVPIHQGELYLEHHRGTYTSQSEVKRMNRLLEQKLKTLETLLSFYQNFGVYQQQIKRIWQEVLLYQFHDILPGSSIKRVYDECLARYDALSKEIDDIFVKAFLHHTTSVTLNDYIYNPLHTRQRITKKIDGNYVVYDLEPFSYQLPSASYQSQANQSIDIFKTKNLTIKLDKKTGFIQTIKHEPTNKELVKGKYANALMVFKDLGNAWDVEDHYREQTPTPMILKQQIIMSYDAFYEIKQTYQFKSSTLKQIILIDKQTDDITFSHEVNWQDIGYMLRSVSQIDIASDVAYYDIQFGQLDRVRTNRNSIESAQFETCGQQWVSIHDDLLSFSVINNAKYGYYLKEDFIDINLLRSTNYPCEAGDIGKTSYQYQFIVRKGNHIENHIDTKAQHFNTHYAYFTEPTSVNPFFDMNDDNISFSTIKQSEDGKSYIIRFYEKDGKETTTHINWSRDIKAVYASNIIEEDIKLLEEKTVTFRPFEIKTFKIHL